MRAFGLMILPSVVLGIFVLLVPSPSLADAPVTDPERLFAEGSALIEKGRCPEALRMLEEAQRLDPGIGTEFNIAVCQQRLGRLGSAWRNFEHVAQLAAATGKKQREQSARAMLAELRPRVPALVIRSDEGDDVTIKVDGVVVPRSSWDFVPIDPGDHRIDATAATKRSWSTVVRAPEEGAKLSVVVPKLTVIERREVVTVEATNSRRTLGFILGGVGVAGVATAAVTGILLLDAKSTAEARCTPKCVNASGAHDAEGADAVNRGRTLLPINAVAWIVAGVGLGAGAFFILTARPSSPSKPPAAAALRVDAMVLPAGGVVRVAF